MNITEAAKSLLANLAQADHLYCSSYQPGVDYFGALEDLDNKKQYRAILTTREAIDELCQLGLLEQQECIKSLAGTTDEIWVTTDKAKEMLAN